VRTESHGIALRCRAVFYITHRLITYEN